MRKPITINPHDYEGAFGLVLELPGQDPILMEIEGDDSARKTIAASVRRREGFAASATRWCIVRLVPVEGNALLIEDMIRLQPKPEADTEEPF